MENRSQKNVNQEDLKVLNLSDIGDIGLYEGHSTVLC
jgi:hypothetical protein